MPVTGGSGRRPRAKPVKAAYSLHNQGVNRTKVEWLAHITRLAGRVCSNMRQRCRGLSVPVQHLQRLSAVLGRAALPDALGNIHACRDAAKAPYPTQDPGQRWGMPSPVLAAWRNCRNKDPFLYRRMRTRWRSGTFRVPRRIVLTLGACTAQAWHSRTWIHLQGMERGRRNQLRALKARHWEAGNRRKADTGRNCARIVR